MRTVLIAALAIAAVAPAAYAQTPASAAPRSAMGFAYSKPDAPIATSVSVPAGAETLYLSGIPSNVAGGTTAQTADVLAKLGAVLKAQGYGYGDVVNMKVYLVGDPALGGKLDFAGMNAAYVKVFGTPTQPNRPSRVTVQIAGLAMPGALVEIEMTAAKVK